MRSLSQGGDPAQVNPVVPTQLIVDHSLAVEHPGFDPEAFEKNREIEDRRNADRFHFIEWTKTAFDNVDVIPAGQRHHAPDQPGEDVSRGPGPRRRGLPGYLRRHRLSYAPWSIASASSRSASAGWRRRR
jgi:hypothetical protein